MPKKRLRALKRRNELAERRRKRAKVDDDRQKNGLDAPLVKHIKLDPKSEDTASVDFISQVTIFHLHSDVWRTIFENMTVNDIIALSSVCKHFQQIVRNTKSDFNLQRNYYLDVNCFLNYAISKSCTSIDINYCSWLTPSSINEMISKTNLRHLHLVQCQMNEDCVRSICNLQLQSLSFTYTKEWKSYFVQTSQESLPFAQNLTKLDIEFCTLDRPSLNLKPNSLIFDIYVNVLQRCEELLQLKLVQNFKGEPTGYEIRSSDFPSQSSALKKLTSLEFDFEQLDCKKDLFSFIESILENKVISLKNVNFGKYTCELFKKGILSHPLILPNRSKFIFRSYYDTPEGETYENYADKISNWMGQTNYELISVGQLRIKDFASFANRMISSSANSIKQVNISDCCIAKNFVKGIELFAIHCPQITALHLITEGTQLEDFDGYDQMMKNETILETIANFKNLKELVISPGILQCYYQTLDYSHMCLNIMPFWKVTQSCEQLNEIRFERSNRDFRPYSVHVNSIYDIAHCKNLKVLKMYFLDLVADSKFRLSEITRSCTQLENLFIHILNENFFLDFSDSLKYIQNLKILRIDYGKRYLTKTFLNSLCFCKKLENIRFYFRGSDYQSRLDIRNLVQVLPKIKNLFVFQIEVIDSLDARSIHLINSIFEKIKKAKPAFSGSFYSYCI